MILEFNLPQISPHMSEARIECLYATPGAALKPGDKLLDLSVDLSSSFSQDCPPVSFFRIVVREKVVFREFRLACGELAKVGDQVALFSGTADEALDQPPQRGIRFATAGIIHHSEMWTGKDR